MFVEYDFDPFSKKPFYGSGLNYLVSSLRPTILRGTTQTTIYLPEDKVAEGLEKTVREAIGRYCRYKIEESQNTQIALRWEGIKALQTGITFLAICLALSFFFKAATFLPEFWSAVLSEGFLIAGWVGIWRPVEIFLYAWWPHWREIRIYETIMKMEIVIRTDCEEQSSL